MAQSPQEIARLIDHALLHPTLTDEELHSGCQLAQRLNLWSVCVKPYAVPAAAKLLAGSTTCVGTVIGFPHGANPTEIKVAEANWCLDRGAIELDMVVNLGKVLAGDWDFVQRDIAAVVQAGHGRNALVKVIFETDFLPDDACKRRLCEISEAAGADFVKTSTGFGFVKQKNGDYNYAGATAHDIQLMRSACTHKVQIKASGGVRSYPQAMEFVRLGATRLGTSASETLLQGAGLDPSSY